MGRRTGWVLVGIVGGFAAGLAGARAEETVPSPADEVAAPSFSEIAEPARLSMEFQEANLRDVLKVFSQQTGINVIAGGEVADVPVTIYFEDVTALDALEQILNAANLTYERPSGSDIYIVRGKAAEEVARTVTRVYRLKYARVSESVLAKAATAFGDATPFEGSSTEAAVGVTAGAGAGVGIDTVIKKLLTDQGAVIVDARTNVLIITDVPENFPRLEAALAVLDVRTPQIMVDAELIETTVTKLKDLGIEWGSGTEGDLVAFFPGGVDVDGEPLSAGRQTRFPFGILDDRAPSLPTPFPTSTLSFNDFQGVLQALESDSDTKVLARPKVMTLDNESAVIRLTSDEAIGFETTTAATAGTTQAEAERTRTGIVLVVTPQVNEHNQITMIVEPSVTKTVVSQLTPPAGTTQPRDPKTRGARALVRVRSGDTLVLGGLIDRTDSETRRKVPILADIPFLGEAFKNTETNDTASELIVFVTPRILTEPPDAQMAAAGAPGQWKAAQEGAVPAVVREQEQNGSRQTFIEQTLNRLEQTGP